MTDGVVFPPRDEWDIAAYPDDQVLKGYCEHNLGDEPPGDNHSPGYRWGWANARKDATHAPDGFEQIRYAYIRMTRHIN
jgi:hypothetical protein